MSERDKALDTAKGILVLIMTAAHLLMFFPEWSGTEQLSVFFTLVCFTGFVFCSGMSCYLAYLENCHGGNRKRILIASLKILVCYYLSALAFQYFVSQEWGFDGVRKVLLFRNMPGYSEFLLAFFCQYILLLFFRKQFQWIFTQECRILLAAVIGLLCTGLTAPLGSGGILGTLLGSREFYSFPILPYSCAFWLGGYLAKHRKGFDFRLVCSGIAILLICHIVPEQMITRFPPSPIFVLKGLAICYLFYVILRAFMRICPAWDFSVLRILGKNALPLLVVGNIWIFRLWSITPEGMSLGISGYFRAIITLAVLFTGWIILKAIAMIARELL